MLKIGCGEQIVDVPLFAELYGYGPFAGRRNKGVHDPLYCRVFTFRDDKNNRAMMVYTDTCTIPDHYASIMRSEFSGKYGIDPQCIAFTATHTHSGPVLGKGGGVGFGAADPTYQENWFAAVRKAADQAVADEEEITCVRAGKAPLEKKLGQNRVEVEKNATDETIRWVQFQRADSTTKVLLHNHGIHGIAMNGNWRFVVSADWMGAANRMIKEQKLADMPFFLLGACGDVNTYTSCHKLNNDQGAEIIAKDYIDYLKKDMAEGGEVLTDLTISGILRNSEIPCVDMSMEDLIRDRDEFTKISKQHVDRLEEVMILKERNHDFTQRHDFQVIRIGELSFFFIPGEYFVEDGASLLARARGKYPLIATVSNGRGAYFPSEANMKRYPDVASFHSCKNNCAFGFYEIYCCYPGMHFRYQDNIASFVADNLLNLEKSI